MNKGVLVVHGIGEYPQTRTLLEIGEPLVQWVRQWAKSVRGREVWLDRGGLGFKTVNDLSGQPPSHVVLHVAPSSPGAADGLDWAVAESWWAGDVPKPRFNDVARWSLVGYLKVCRKLWLHLLEGPSSRFRWWDAEQRALSRGSVREPGVVRAIDAANRWALAVLFLPGYLAALVPIVILLLLTQVPVDKVRNFALIRGLQNFLDLNMADMQAITEDQVVAADLRQRVLDALCWLISEQNCEELYVISHSGGAVLAFEALSAAPDYHGSSSGQPSPIAKVKKLLTFGEGLNKAFEINPQLERLQKPLAPGIEWKDFWSAYDPVPVTPLYKEVASLQNGRYDPVCVVNQMDLASDHGLYWSNDEEVLSRLAKEIAPEPEHEAFWAPAPVRDAFVAVRRKRVAFLVAMRMWAILLALASVAFRGAAELRSNGALVWSILQQFPGVSGSVDHLTTGLSKWPFTVELLKGLGAAGEWALGAGLVVAAFWLIQQLFVNFVWDAWDIGWRRAFSSGATYRPKKKNKPWSYASPITIRFGLVLWPLILTAAPLWLSGFPARGVSAMLTAAAAGMVLAVVGAIAAIAQPARPAGYQASA